MRFLSFRNNVFYSAEQSGGAFAASGENHILEIRILNSNSTSQEIEITYGSKKKRKIITSILPKNLTNDFYTNVIKSPSIKVSATNLSALSQHKNDFVFKEKLLHALAKVNILSQNTKDGDIDFQKLWDGEKRIVIDNNFALLTEQQKQHEFDLENLRRRNFLTTVEKAILLALVNNYLNQKIDRGIISKLYAEISDKNFFRFFIIEILKLISNPHETLCKFFPQILESENYTGRVMDIIFESDFDKRSHKIRLLKTIEDHAANDERSKFN